MNPKSIKLTKTQVFDAMETGKLIKEGKWKYGYTETYVAFVESEGEMYKFTVEYHPSEGIMPGYDTLIAERVKPQERQVTITDWITY